MRQVVGKDGRQLRTGEAATELNVSESTVLKWCREDLLRTVRTAGGHRRIDAESVAELAAVLVLRDDQERAQALEGLRARNRGEGG